MKTLLVKPSKFVNVIYETTNLLTGRKYIGKDQRNDPKYLGSNKELKEDIKRLGKENFKKQILDFCLNLNELVDKEKHYLKSVNASTNPLYYNKTNGSGGRCLGFKVSDITKIKISKANKGFKHTEEVKDRIRNWKKNFKVSDETCLKISNSKKGCVVWNKGKKLSEDHVRKIRESKNIKNG